MADAEDDAGFLLRGALEVDRERTLPTLFAAQPARAGLCALVLLNQELARVPETVSQTMPGLIRFQWWRDALEAGARGEGPNHPVVRALGPLIAAKTLPIEAVHALVDAREAELEGLEPENLWALETYLAATAGRLQGLMCRVLLPDDRAFDAAAAKAGTAYGLLGVVRAVGHHAGQSRVLLPRDLLDAAEVTPEMVIQRQHEERLAAVTAALVERAKGLIDQVAKLRPPRQVMPAFLLLVQARRHAGRKGWAPPLAMLYRYWRRRP